MKGRSLLGLHADPSVRAHLPALRSFWRVYLPVCGVAAVLLGAGGIAGGRASLIAGALAPLGPVVVQVYLGVLLWRRAEGWLQRYWRAMSVGVALCGVAFLSLALRDLLARELVLVLQGLLIPSATFSILFALWVRFQASRGVTSTVGFFDTALVVTTALAYLTYLFTAPYVSRSGPEGGLGAWVLVACSAMLVFVLALLGRRPRVPGLTSDQLLTVSLCVALTGVVVAFLVSFVSGRGAMEAAPGWVFGAGWALAFGIGALCPYAEVAWRRSVPDRSEPRGTRPYWPYVVLGLTPPLVVYAVVFSPGEGLIGTLVATLLVVEVLVVRQFVFIGEQRTARARARVLKEAARGEADRVNVLLELALCLSEQDETQAMCDAVASAVSRVQEVECAAVIALTAAPEAELVSARFGTGSCPDPCAVWQTLEQLGLRVAGPVEVAPAWAGFPPGRDVVVATVIGADGSRLGYVALRPAGDRTTDTAFLEGVADQLALALDRAGLVDGLRRRADCVREVVDRLDEGLADLDPERTVRACNAAFAAFTGRVRDEIVGRPFPASLLASVDVASLQMRLDAGVVVSEVELTDPSGEERVYEFSLVPRQGNAGGREGVLVVVRDVGDERRERRSLLRLLDDLILAGSADSVGVERADPPVLHEVAVRLRDEVVPEMVRVKGDVARLNEDGTDTVTVVELARELSRVGVAVRDLMERASWEDGT